MQQRVSIKHFTEFPAALKAKKGLEVTNPTVTYQIRRFKNGFNLVRRYPVNEIARYEEHYQKKRTGLGKRQRKNQIDAAFLSEVRSASKT